MTLRLRRIRSSVRYMYMYCYKNSVWLWIPTNMKAANLHPKFLFGLTTNVTDNCLYWNDNVIVYPASGNIVIYDLKNSSQRFIKLPEYGCVITAMDINVIKYTYKIWLIIFDSFFEVELPFLIETIRQIVCFSIQYYTWQIYKFDPFKFKVW